MLRIKSMLEKYWQRQDGNMIKAINTGTGLTVINGHTSWPSFYNNSTASNNTLVGQVRYNGSSQNMEVYDGVTWLCMSAAYPSIELSPDVQTVLNWARAKMSEEAKLEKLAADNPTLRDALDALRQAEEQVRIVAALVTT